MERQTPGQRFVVKLLLAATVLLNATASDAAPSGFYLGASLGESEFDDVGELETACALAGIICAADDTDDGYKLFIGYQMSDYLGLEGGYVDLGQLDAGVGAPIPASAGFDVRGGFFALLPQLPVGGIGTIFARLGLSVGDAKLTARVPAVGFDESDSGTAAGVIFGLGGAIHLGRATVRVEWERYSFDEAFTIAGEDLDAPDVDLISGSVLLWF